MLWLKLQERSGDQIRVNFDAVEKYIGGKNFTQIFFSAKHETIYVCESADQIDAKIEMEMKKRGIV